MSKIEINGNFHRLKKRGLSPFDLERYKEYRKKWEEYPSKRRVGRFPIHLDIEATSSCNLKCDFCITTHANFGNGLMELERYKSIIDEGSEKGLYSLKLNWRGEPLLHPKLPEMISYAKDKGIIDVFINTNAVLLTEAKSKTLIESGIDRIIISFEGYEKEFYESQRVGAVFEKTLENIKNFMSIKEKLNKSLPWVRVQTVLLEELKSNIENYCEFWDEIVDEVAYIDLKNEVNRVALGKSDWICPQLWQRMTISWDGRVMPCVNDTFCKMCLGKVPEISIEEAWKSDKLMQMRKIHDDGRAHTIESCLDCPLRSAQIIKTSVLEKGGE
ncbi:radical SAM protein [bacterium]|nr:radical SAM protein [bacterium]